MTVVKRTRDADDEPLFDIPPALLAELETMNKNIEQNKYEMRVETGQSPEEQINVAEPVMAEAQMPETPDEDPLAEYRLEILGKAAHIVTRDRNVEYGTPENTFKTIANLWSSYLGIELLTTDVAALMALMKIARLQANPFHEDTWTDLAGYAACGASNAKAMMDQSETA